jgi:hypothetical protein
MTTTPNPAEGRTVTDTYGQTHELFGPYNDLHEVKGANRAKGHHWFEPESMRFFGCRIESVVLYGRLFVTSEQPPVEFEDPEGEPRRYSIRVATDDGAVHTVGEFRAWTSKDDALDALHAIAQGRCSFTNWTMGCRLPAGHDGDHLPLEEVALP